MTLRDVWEVVEAVCVLIVAIEAMSVLAGFGLLWWADRGWREEVR